MLSLSQRALRSLISAHKFIVKNECGILMIVVGDLIMERNLAKALCQSTSPQTIWREVLYYQFGYLKYRQFSLLIMALTSIDDVEFRIDHDPEIKQFDCLLLHAICQLHAGISLSLFVELNGISFIDEVVSEHEHLTLELHRRGESWEQQVRH